LEFPYVTPFPLPPAKALNFLATYILDTLSNLAFQIGKTVTPAANATVASKCGQDIRKPSKCGWDVWYQGQMVENFTHFSYNPVDANAGLNFTVLLDFSGSAVTENNFFWCTQMPDSLPDSNCLLHRTLVIDLDGDAAKLAEYKSALYFQATKELLEWVAVVEMFAAHSATASTKEATNESATDEKA
jgi:hypothetical protein